MPVGLSKCLKQIIWIKINRFKNPKWLEANKLAIYKRDQGFELGTTENKSSKRSERVLELGASELQAQRAKTPLTTRPNCGFDGAAS